MIVDSGLVLPPPPPPPPKPGQYLGQIGKHCVCSCGCKLHIDLVEIKQTKESMCENCSTNVNIYHLEIAANKSLRKLMEQGVRQRNLE
jgi:hypothetical protein